jgi:hypothetical protein
MKEAKVFSTFWGMQSALRRAGIIIKGIAQYGDKNTGLEKENHTQVIQPFPPNLSIFISKRCLNLMDFSKTSMRNCLYYT